MLSHGATPRTIYAEALQERELKLPDGCPSAGAKGVRVAQLETAQLVCGAKGQPVGQRGVCDQAAQLHGGEQVRRAESGCTAAHQACTCGNIRVHERSASFECDSITRASSVGCVTTSEVTELRTGS